MAKSDPIYSITKAENEKLPLNLQRYNLTLGYVKGEEPPADVAEKQDAKAKK